MASVVSCVDVISPSQTGLRSATERIGQSEIGYSWITSDHPGLRWQNGRWYLSASELDATSENDLFIAFSAERNRAYLVFRRHRLDGGIALSPMVEPVKIRHGIDLLESGIIFRFRDLSNAAKNSLEEYLAGRSTGVSLTCVRGALRSGPPLFGYVTSRFFIGM